MGSSAGGAFLPGDPPPTTGMQLIGPLINSIPIIVTAAPTLSNQVQDNKLIVCQNAAGMTITLPPATGSGARYQFIIGTTLTSSSFIVKVANSNDYMRGWQFTVSAGAASTFATANTGTVATETDTITWNRTTTGLGTIGDYIELIDQQANVWALEIDNNSSGTAATPFSSTV